MIDIKTLKPSSIGKGVVYQSINSPEYGFITGWNEQYIWVNFNHEVSGTTSLACEERHLNWYPNILTKAQLEFILEREGYKRAPVAGQYKTIQLEDTDLLLSMKCLRNSERTRLSCSLEDYGKDPIQMQDIEFKFCNGDRTIVLSGVTIIGSRTFIPGNIVFSRR